MCAQYCEALCQNQLRFCAGSQCSVGACQAAGEIAGDCAQQCDSSSTGSDPIGCARDLCLSQVEEDITCETFGFEAEGEFVNLCLDADPACVPAPDLGCTNTCGTHGEGVGGDLVV